MEAADENAMTGFFIGAGLIGMLMCLVLALDGRFDTSFLIMPISSATFGYGMGLAHR